MLEEPRQPCPPGALTLPRGAHLLPEDTWAGWEAFPSHQMGGEWAGRQGQFIHCRDVGQVGDCPSVCLSVCQEGSWYSRSASVPNRWLSALTARRGRGAKEKAPGEEQSRSGPMPEQEEGADRVSAAGKQGSWVNQHQGSNLGGRNLAPLTFSGLPGIRAGRTCCRLP